MRVCRVAGTITVTRRGPWGQLARVRERCRITPRAARGFLGGQSGRAGRRGCPEQPKATGGSFAPRTSPASPLCPRRGAMPSAGTPQPWGPWPPSHPPRPPHRGTGALPGAFITLQQTTVSLHITSRHRRSGGARGAEPPRPRAGSTGRCPPPSPAAPCGHRDPFASARLQRADLGRSPCPATSSRSPAQGGWPRAPAPSLLPHKPGAAPGCGMLVLHQVVGITLGCLQGHGAAGPEPCTRSLPEKGTSMGAGGTGLTSERPVPVPLLPLQQRCTQG